MGSDLQIFKLGERCLIKSSKRIFAREYVPDGIPFWRSKDVIDKSLGIFNEYDLFISENRFREISEKFGHPQNGDLLISSVGNRCGLPYVVRNEGDFYFKDGNILWLSCFRALDPEYLSYWLKSDIGFQKLKGVMIGSAQKAITIDALRGLEVAAPSYENQLKVVQVLDSINKKITLNRQINQTLEQMAQALFKSWFVDFDPVIDNALAAGNPIPDELQPRAEQRKALQLKASGESGSEGGYKPLPESVRALFPDAFEESELGWVPEGWGTYRLDTLLELAYGKALKKTDRVEGNYPVYGSGGIAGTHNQHLVQGPGVIVGRKGTVGSLYWEPNHFYPIDTVFYVKPKDGYSLHYCFELLKTLGLENMNTDAAVPGLNRNNAYRLLVPKAPKELIDAFSELVMTYRSRMTLCSEETESLTNLRDTLLPKLISGELQLDQLPDVVESVA